MKIKFNFKSASLMMFFVAMSSFVFAQRTITGSVTDAETNESLIGASVVVTGTTKGTLTDVDGKYTLTDVPANATSLTFSFTGYSSLTVNLGTSNVVDAKLNGGEVLEQVVVVGYGSVKKSDLTGAVNTITEKDFNRGVITSAEQLLQGRTAGVQISQNGGEPGGGISIRVRGTNSVRGGNNPLFVIDGVPLNGDDVTPDGQTGAMGSSSARNPLNFLNPADIEKIDVLKDASATAIYGSRGANGVVLITTKKGKKGQSGFDYSYSLAASSITKKYDLLSASEYTAAQTALGAPSNNLGGSTDWQDVVLQTGLTNSHNVSYSSSTDKGNYRVSFGSMDQEGIFRQSGFKRYSARFNAEQKFLNDKLTLGVNLTAANTKDNGVPVTNNSGFNGDLLGGMLKSNPTLSIYKYNSSKTLDCDTCTINQPSSNSEANPAAILRYSKDVTNTLRAMGNMFAEYKLMEGLTFKSVLGFDRSMSQRRAAYSPLLNNDNLTTIGGRATIANVGVSDALWDNYLTYNKTFGDVDFTGLLGYSYQSFGYSTDRSTMIGFPTDSAFTSDMNYMLNNAAAASKSIVNNSSNTFDELQSTFARINVGYKGKYLLTASVRRDGSTRFGGDNQNGLFPSFALKWRLSEESFIPKNIFSDLSVRVGYGVTGSQSIPHNLYAQRTRYNDATFDNSNIITGGRALVATNNAVLGWEQTSQYNIGLDFGFMDNRITGSLDYYDKSTDRLLINDRGDGSAPSSVRWRNLDADLENKGVELSLNIVAFDSKDFKWNVAFNVANNKNTVKSLSGLAINTGAINGQGLSGAFAQQIREGYPLGAFFIRQANGYDANGLSKYVDGNDAQLFVGQTGLPTWTGGITNNLSYKGVDLSLFFNGSFGNYIYNNTANAYFTKGSLASGRNVTKDVPASAESKDNAPEPSTRFLEKGDFVRLANLSLGYNIPYNAGGKVKNLRIFVTGQNILTFTNYTGQDPEVNTNKSIDGVPSFGIDYTAYPRAKTWTAGVNVSF